MSSLNIGAKVFLADLAREIAHQHEDTEVLQFIGDLDEQMASWDFTNEAVEMFVSRSLDLHRADDQSVPTARAGLARVAEFIRQIRINPAVQRDDAFYTTWTDPAAQPASLLVSDMELLLELAASALTREEK